MIGAVAFLLIFLVPTVWLFARAQPRTDRVIAVRRFNVATVLIATASMLTTAVYFWATTGHSVDSGWWVPLAVLGGTVFVCVVLAVATALRYLIFCRSSVFRSSDANIAEP